MKRYNKDVIFSHLLTGCLKQMIFYGKTGITAFKLIQNAKAGGWGCFGKFRIFATRWALRFSKLKKK